MAMPVRLSSTTVAGVALVSVSVAIVSVGAGGGTVDAMWPRRTRAPSPLAARRSVGREWLNMTALYQH